VPAGRYRGSTIQLDALKDVLTPLRDIYRLTSASAGSTAPLGARCLSNSSKLGWSCTIVTNTRIVMI
jgi:hypothetical protein